MKILHLVPQYVIAVISTSSVIGAAYCAYRLYQRKKNKLPDQWTHVGHLKSLHVYPIKSCAPIMLNQVECSTLGMRDGWLRDRFLMIIDAKTNHFVTARIYPELIKIQPSIKKAILTLAHPGMNTIQVNLAEVMITQKPFQATVWKTSVPVYDCGEEVNTWITKFLNQPGMNFCLVYYASQNSRPLLLSAKYREVFTKWRKTDNGALPDQVSFNLVNEASVDDLNSRLENVQVNENNFRPNILVSGPEAYDEDKWKYVKIGENIFEVIKPCSRCKMICIDPKTAVRNKGMEPLNTLKSYRLSDDPLIRKVTGQYPRMGIHMALRTGSGGTVLLNDPIYVSY